MKFPICVNDLSLCMITSLHSHQHVAALAEKDKTSMWSMEENNKSRIKLSPIKLN